MPYILNPLKQFVIDRDKLEHKIQKHEHLPFDYPVFTAMNHISEERTTGHVANYFLQVKLLYNELQHAKILTSDCLTVLTEFLHLYSAYEESEEQEKSRPRYLYA